MQRASCGTTAGNAKVTAGSCECPGQAETGNRERERERERLGNVPLRPRHPGRPPQLTRDTEGFRDPSDERERTL